MFAVELKFASNCLLKWFNRNFKIQNMEIDHKEKFTYEAFNPIDQKKQNVLFAIFPRSLMQKFQMSQQMK